MNLKKVLKGIVLVVVILVTATLIFGYAAGEQKYTFDTVVDASLEKTWNTFQNPMYFKKWMSGFKEIEMLDGVPGMPGSEYLVTIENDGEEQHLKQKVTISDPPVHFAFDMENEVLIGHIDVQLKQNNQGQTLITNTVTYHGVNPFWNALLSMMNSHISEGYQGDFNRLKAFTEQR